MYTHVHEARINNMCIHIYTYTNMQTYKYANVHTYTHSECMRIHCRMGVLHSHQAGLKVC